MFEHRPAAKQPRNCIKTSIYIKSACEFICLLAADISISPIVSITYQSANQIYLCDTLGLLSMDENVLQFSHVWIVKMFGKYFL